MTDALMEEIYGLAREAFIGGQDAFEVHAFPFRMTNENMARHRDSPYYAFWQTLKEGYEHFELARVPPSIAVCERRTWVNATFRGTIPARLDADGYCPPYEKTAPDIFVPTNQQIAGSAFSVPARRCAP